MMNDLSWLIYWADVLPSIAVFLTVICALLACALTVMVALGVTDFFGDANKVATRDNKLYGWKEGDFINPNLRPLAERFRKLTPLAVIVWLMIGGLQAVPERETFYAIAASEMGEAVLETPEAKKAMQALNAWLDNKIEGAK